MRDAFYRLLGMFAWTGAKTYLRQKYGAKMVPAPVLAGAVVVVGALVGLVVAKRDS